MNPTCPGCKESVPPDAARRPTPLTTQLARLPVPPARTTALTREVQRLVGAQLGRVPRPDEGLFAAGMESKQLVALTAELSEVLGMEIPSSFVLEHPDVKTLVAHFALALDLAQARPRPG